MADSLRLLVVIDNFHPLVGGAEQAALGSARALAARGHRVDVLAMRKQAAWPAEEQLGDVRVLRFDERVPPRPLGRLLYERANAAAARRFVDHRLARNAYHAIFLHPIDAAFGVARSRAAAHTPLVYCFHAPLGQEARVESRGLLRTTRGVLPRLGLRLSAALAARYRERHQRRTILRSDAVTCPSQYARGLLEGLVGDLGDRPAEVVPWGVDAERFRPPADRQAVRDALGWPRDEPVAFTARRLVPRMGLDALIRAVALTAPRQVGLRLAIAGAGPLRGELEALAAARGARVDFLGFVPDDELCRCYQAADLVVVPSADLEAFGLVLLEALACGTPAFATRRGAPPEILLPLDERLLMASDEPQAIAAALVGPGLKLARAARFREHCRAYVVEHYSWARTAAALEEVARQAIGRATRRGKAP